MKKPVELDEKAAGVCQVIKHLTGYFSNNRRSNQKLNLLLESKFELQLK